MKTAFVAVEESHYTAPKATEYPYNVWLEGRWFHLETGGLPVELGDEIMVKYDPQDQFATVKRSVKLPPTEAEKQAEKIYQHLFTQKFADWYGDNGHFGMHLRGDFIPGTATTPTKEQVMVYIKKHFLV